MPQQVRYVLKLHSALVEVRSAGMAQQMGMESLQALSFGGVMHDSPDLTHTQVPSLVYPIR